jgi:flagellar biosynthesis/type III secretory pathway M-ring protein FliF/YscJ
MSVTQRVAVTFLILTVVVCLTFAAWLGTTPGETGRRPLPMAVEPGDVNAILDRLREKGIRTAEYNFESRRVLVNVDEEKSAVIAMAEEGLLKDAHAYGFDEMLERWSFSDTRMHSEESMRLARANEVARLIENLENVAEAQVIYSDDARTSLFGVAHKKSAAVRVKTNLQKRLTEDAANTIIALVSSAKAGLDPRDVVVADQYGNKFHTSAANGLGAMAKQKWDTELALADEMRRKLESLMRQFIPNLHYEGDVNAFPKYEVVFDYRESLRKDVLPGEVANSSTHKLATRSSKRPSEEPGVQPNVSRSANLNNPAYWYTEETTHNENSAERSMQNSILETATKFAPNVANLTVSAIIQLPYRLRRDGQGQPVQAKNELGEPLIDPVSRHPVWEKESVERLAPAQLDELRRLIAQAANIPLAQIPEKIEVAQVDWTPPPVSPPGGEPPLAFALSLLRRNGTAIVTFVFFALAVLMAYRYATRPIPTEVEEPIDPETLKSLDLTGEAEDEEEVDEEWGKLRAKVMAVVQEDPKRAANLIKRWMRKE